MAMVQPFLVNPDYEDGMSFVESSAASQSLVQVREDTPSPPPWPPVQRRGLFGTAAAGPSTGPGASTAPSPAQLPQQRRERGGLRSLCCGLFSRRRHHTNASSTGPSPPRQPLHPMSQRQAPSAHSTIFEEDEDEEGLDDQENVPPPSVANRRPAIFEHQTRTIIGNQPNRPSTLETQYPTIIETLVDDYDHNTHEQQTLNDAEQEITEQEMVDELNVPTRSSVRHSWVTVSRWLE